MMIPTQETQPYNNNNFSFKRPQSGYIDLYKIASVNLYDCYTFLIVQLILKITDFYLFVFKCITILLSKLLSNFKSLMQVLSP